MKETINVNIASQSFTMDDDAYRTLNIYLEDIASRLGEDDKEIMADVESRIAEIFREKATSPMMVITIATVKKAMAQMGRPEEFGERREARSDNNTAAGKSRPEKLYRPVADRCIGGVCSGLARYFNIDTLLVRLLTFFLVCFGGMSLWVYIILWIVMPSETSLKYKYKN